MRHMLFVVNPKSGKVTIKSNLLAIVDEFTKAGYIVTVYTTQKPKDATETVKKYGNDFDVIVCAGGDGTLDEVVTGVMELDISKPIGYIPSGSTNDFARSMGISADNVEAAKIITNDKLFQCDLGRFNEDYFTYIAAFGAFTEVSYSTPQQTKNVLGHLAYILEGEKSLPSIQAYDVKVEYEDTVIEDRIIYGMVTNSISVGGMKSFKGENVCFDDGLFEVLLIKEPKNALELNSILGSLLLNDVSNDNMYFFKASKVKISSTEDISWTLDGEFGGDHKEAVIHNEKQAMSIFRNMEVQ